MEWKQEYSIGIPEIDDHHREIFRIVASLLETAGSEHDWRTIHFHLVQLSELVDCHFRVEQVLMRILGYPRREEHAGRHGTILASLHDLLARSLTHDASNEAVVFARDWFFDHILNDDVDYGDFARRHGPGFVRAAVAPAGVADTWAAVPHGMPAAGVFPGMPELDEDHQKIACLSAELVDAAKARECWHAMDGILARLAVLAKRHFEVEEALMRILPYPGYKTHKGSHEDILQLLARLSESLLRSNAIDDAGVAHLRQKMVVGHMGLHDRSLAAYLAAACWPAAANLSLEGA